MDTYKLRSFHLGKLALFDKAMQLGHDVGFQQPFFGIGQAKVSEHIAAALVDFDFMFNLPPGE